MTLTSKPKSDNRVEFGLGFSYLSSENEPDVSVGIDEDIMTPKS